jgi:hypothetical protein
MYCLPLSITILIISLSVPLVLSVQFSERSKCSGNTEAKALVRMVDGSDVSHDASQSNDRRLRDERLFPSPTRVRFEFFTAVTMKNGVFWDVTPCGSCKNRR